MIQPIIRPGNPADLVAIEAIQQASPEAAFWDVSSYLNYDLRVAVCENRVSGFLVWRAIDAQEAEILNIAVSPEFRRLGIARALIRSLLSGYSGAVFLEVRASNEAARNLYKSVGFVDVSRREDYYDSPPEAAIVMKFHSC